MLWSGNCTVSFDEALNETVFVVCIILALSNVAVNFAISPVEKLAPLDGSGKLSTYDQVDFKPIPALSRSSIFAPHMSPLYASDNSTCVYKYPVSSSFNPSSVNACPLNKLPFGPPKP